MDTDAAVTIISQTLFKQYLPKVNLNSIEVALQMYTAEQIKILGGSSKM